MHIIYFIITILHIFFQHCVAHAFSLGVENISSEFIQKHQLDTLSVGLVTNQTGVDSKGSPTAVVLRKKGIKLTSIFVPEHGYTGTIAAGHSVLNTVDPVTQLPIVSLYSHEKGLIGRAINAEKLDTVEVLIFDIQDSGMRHYTYISTLMRCIEACGTYNKKLIVLDRPNLLGGFVHGPLVEPDLISFISIAQIPLRHGMTIGELARFFNNCIVKKKSQLIVVPMYGYTRTSSASYFKKPLSPNLKNYQACLGYSFLGLLGELSPCNIGIGTLYAFRCIMLPCSIKAPAALWLSLQHLFTKYGISSIRHTVTDSRTRKKVTGLLLQFKDMSHTNTFALFLDIVSLLMKHKIQLRCAPTFDKAIGISAVRLAIERRQSLESFKQQARLVAEDFYKKVERCLLYQPHPWVH